MDTKISTTTLASVRTFAKDLEKKRLQKPEAASKVTTTVEITPKAAVVLPASSETLAERKYQAPTWTSNKTKPAEPAAVVPKTSDTSELKTPSTKEGRLPVQVLKPITAPKSVESTNIIVENEDAATATIIRDTKKNRFRLFPAIFTSIGSWFKDQRRKQQIKKVPKYTVPEASRRKGVIQRATSKTGKTTSFDHVSIQERIKQRQERTAPKMPGLTWSANTEPGFPLLEAPATVSTIKNVQVLPRKSFRTPKAPALPPLPAQVPVPKTDDIDLPLPPVLIPTPAPVATYETPAPLINQAPEPAPQLVPINTEVIPTYQAPAPAVETVSAVREEASTQNISTSLKPSGIREWLFLINTNTVSILVAGLVLVTAIFVFTSYFWLTKEATIAVVMSPSYPTLIEAPLQLVQANDLNKLKLQQLITANYQENPFDVLQLILVEDTAGETLVPTQTLVEALEFSLDNALTQAITHIYFGSIEKNQPFILFKITDTTTARGGMLEWEDSIYQNIAPLMAANQAVDDSSSKTAVFVDAIIAGNDVRILRTLAGAEILVYGLTDRNTVLITPNSSIFKEIIKLKK